MNKTLLLVYTALLTAIAALANISSIQIQFFGATNYMTFTYIPCFLAGMYFGIIPAAVVGFVGDLIGNFVNPMGSYNPLIALASTLLGVIPALIYKIPRLNKLPKLFLSLALCTLICTSGLNTLALWLMFGKGKTFFVYLAARLPFQALMFAVNGAVLVALQQSKAVDKLLKRSAERISKPPKNK